MSWLQKLFGTGHRRSPAPVAPLSVPMLPPSKPIAPLKLPDVRYEDWELVRQNWNDQLRHEPGMSPEKFLQILESRHNTFASERREREARLAQLQASIKPVP